MKLNSENNILINNMLTVGSREQHYQVKVKNDRYSGKS